jgi:hypothetical protein
MKTARNTISSLIAASAMVLGTVGCAEQPPELPPVASMSADISSVDSAPAIAKNAALQGDGEYTNFANGWVRVALVRAWATGVLLVPAASMGIALTQEPHKQGDRWVWSVTVGATTGDLELSADLADGWTVEFYVSNQQLDRYLWIEGHFVTDLTSGYWLGHDPNLPAGDDEVLEISWQYTSPTDHSLEYSNVNSSSPDIGDVLSYTRSGQTATVVFDDASEPDQVATVSWDTTTGAGSIEVPLYNGGAEACWGSTFQNAPCE